MSSEILVKYSGRRAVISLNRPKANSYYKDFLQVIAEAITEASTRDQVKVILINSTSEKFFCAGADIQIFAANTTEDNSEMVIAARAVSQAIVDSPKIVIAAVKGHILGGGLEMAMACDIRLAAEGDYLIGLPEVKLGLMPGNGGTPRMIDLLGASRAMELLLTGDNVNAQKAYDFGLFNQLFPAVEFEEQVDQYISKLENGAGKAMAAIKAYVQNYKGMSKEKALAYETECVNALYNTFDGKEGFNAFVEKREPKYE